MVTVTCWFCLLCLLFMPPFSYRLRRFLCLTSTGSMGKTAVRFRRIRRIRQPVLALLVLLALLALFCLLVYRAACVIDQHGVNGEDCGMP